MRVILEEIKLDINYIIGRSTNLFDEDVIRLEIEIREIVQNSSFLVIGRPVL